jgi:hypothetical protein
MAGSDQNSARPQPIRLKRILIALLLFGISFGYLEAAIVVYLRAIYDPMRQRLHPDREPGDLFPLIRVDQLRAEGPEHVLRLAAELGREAATLIMLAAVALAVASNFRQWSAAFIIIFGVWDIFYYVFLKLILDWPSSLQTWDILFLLPVPWIGPVWAPMLVALAMICTGILILWREFRGRPISLSIAHWAAIMVGGLIIVLSFCWDFRNITAGGIPNPFNWPLFALGLIIGLTGFLLAFTREPGRK